MTPILAALSIAFVPLALGLAAAVAILIWEYVAMGYVFKKAGIAQWKAWVPVYNFWVFLRLGGRSGIWVVLPVLSGVAADLGIAILTSIAASSDGMGGLQDYVTAGNAGFVVTLLFAIVYYGLNIAYLVVLFMAVHHVSRGFGQSTGYTVLGILLFPVWLSILAWGPAKWSGEAHPDLVRTEKTEKIAALAAASPSNAVLAPIGSGHEGNVRDQFMAYFRNLRSGEMGALPALAGFIILVILFSALSSTFFSPLNFANLLTQAATLMMLAMALVFVILLGEIDLSAGVTSGVTASIVVVLIHNSGVNWIVALIIALVVGAAIGTFIGFFVARVGIPSFVVTLGLFLGFQGLQLIIIGTGGAYRVETPQLVAIMNNNIPIPLGWSLFRVAIVIAVVIALFDRERRTRAGVANRPLGLMWLRLGAITAGGALFVALMSLDRAAGRGSLNGVPIAHDAIEGVPIVVPIAVAILWIGTFILDRTRYGRHLYAVGGNPEAARRAGIKVATVRIIAFITCSSLAVVSGVFDASRIGVVTAASGGQIVLSGVAAAVVGGVSLFGGRGRLVHAAIGALVIAVIANGLGLLGLPAGANFLVTGGVLILAATIDAVSRKRAGGSLLRT